MRCAQCGRDNRAGAAFCDGCGTPLTGAAAPGATFVGRREELLMLHAALEQARAGQGGLVLVGGEAGIGKSRLAQECAARAAEPGFRVLWGRCLEDSGAPPYWPWLQLMRSWLDGADEAPLREAAGSDGSLLLDLLPELGRRLPELEPAAPLTEPAHARFRLFEAIQRLWQRSARRQPLLLILDNLHVADSASLRLLQFLAPGLGTAGLLVLGTYRTSELSRDHPLSGVLSEVAALPHCRRLTLGGLEPAEAERLLSLLNGQRPLPAALVSAIHAQSEGNPLFIRELARGLIQQGRLAADHGAAPDMLQVPIPEGIREVLRQRLGRLSAACAELLAMAAVIGRSFELELLVGLGEDLSVAVVLEALDEALGAGLIEELAQPGRYQFSHALIRETLYDELPATRRLTLHQRIGQQLKTVHGDESPARLPRLAYHFGQAAPLGSAPQAITYATRAGARADALLAYEEAVRFYSLAAELQSRYAENDASCHCSLLLALGTAQYKAGEYVRAMASFRSAAANARARGAAADMARAALGYEEASWRPGLPGTTACQLLRDAVAAVGSGDARLEARLLSALTRALIFTGDVERSVEVQKRAVTLARRLEDPGLLAGALCAGLSARWQPECLAERLEAGREAIRLAEQAGDWELMFGSLSWQLFDLLEAADMATLRATLERHSRLVEELRQPFFRYIAVSFRAVLALLEGRFELSEQLARQALALGQHQGLDALGVFSLQMFSIERERGGLTRMAPVLEQFLRSARSGAVWRPGLALLYTELGRLEQARDELEHLALDDFAAVPRDGLWVTCLAYLAEVCAVLGDARRARELYRHLLPYAGHNVVAGTTVACYGAADRYLGLLAATGGEPEAAAGHLEAAIALHRRTGARPFLARSQHDYAALLLAVGTADGRGAASTLLGEARATASELGMETLVQQIHRLSRQARLPVAEEVNPDGLSRRELQVLRLLAAGRSNRDIATGLFVSPNTVANHVRSILAKTGTSNRTEAAAYARRHSLLEG